MSASDSEYEEEEILVFADFKNNIILNELEDANTSIKIIGIDSDNPIAEVNGNIFKGKYEFSMGTHVFFEEDDEPLAIDPIYEKHAKRTFKYFNKTNKVLHFSRIFVEPESNSTEPPKEDETIKKLDEKSSLRVDKTYEEALKQLKPQK